MKRNIYFLSTIVVLSLSYVAWQCYATSKEEKEKERVANIVKDSKIKLLRIQRELELQTAEIDLERLLNQKASSETLDIQTKKIKLIKQQIDAVQSIHLESEDK